MIADGDDGDENCPICHAEMTGTALNQGVTLMCGHRYHPRCILLWMRRTLAPFMARQAPFCPACLYPLAGTRGAFAEPPPIIPATEDLKKLSQDIDAAYDRLPWTEKRRAARGHRHENVVLMGVRAYRFNLDFSAVVIICYGGFASLLAARTLDDSDLAASERQFYLFALAVSVTTLFDRQKQIVPEAVLCFLKHAAVLRAVLYTALMLSRGPH